MAHDSTRGSRLVAPTRKFAVADLPELPTDDTDLEDRKESFTENGQTFSQMLEESQKGIRFQEGEVVEGLVVTIGHDYITIDIGYKSEGQVNASEFLDNTGELTIAEGDHVLVYIERVEDDYGRLILSKEKADVLRAWDEISEACEKNELVEGTVVAKVKGGLSVDIGVKAFLPGSQVDVRPTKNLDQFLGKTFKFKIIKFNKKRGNIVLSRRLLLMEERARMKEQTLSKIEEGMVTEGVIKNLTEYGAFIDLGGLDGLLHITDMSWGRLKHPSELFKIGDKIQVKVLKYDEEKERVSLGYKQLLPDPWNSVQERYTVGMRVKGKVVSLTDYGAFVELEPGVEGLVHVSEMSWTQRVKHPSKLVNEGDVVEAVVLDVDTGNRRISMGMKQIEPNPWDILIEKYPVGSKIKGAVKNTTDFGVFVGVPEGVDGLIHVSDIAWDKQNPDPNTMFKKGDEVECIVLAIDKAAEKFSLGIKQLSDDPWRSVAERYPLYSRVKGKVTKVADFGVFLEIENGVEGLLHISELENIEGKTSKEKLKSIEVGTEIECLITAVDMKEHKLGLSVRALEKHEERENIKHYAKQASSSSRTSLGEMLEQSLAQKLKEAAASTTKEPADDGGGSENQ
ncbi:MAG: 30S ribosomal protein S1 [Deltaproteobacteria bacterium]|nr:30S ribosomal protein S1 [Deltaproteobacteria bacterium]MBI3296273.1 30S ribosomal protein S1 [Deltaproteobacteria bacterium]